MTHQIRHSFKVVSEAQVAVRAKFAPNAGRYIKIVELTHANKIFMYAAYIKGMPGGAICASPRFGGYVNKT